MRTSANEESGTMAENNPLTHDGLAGFKQDQLREPIIPSDTRDMLAMCTVSNF